MYLPLRRRRWQVRLKNKSHTFGLAKKVIPLIVKLYLRFTDDIEIYEDGTLEAVFPVSIEKRALGLPNTHFIWRSGLFNTHKAKV
jgi:hypothetical protein